jgi:hypothetical protein
MPLDLDDPTAIALAIFRARSDRRIEAALYGGLALAAYGEPRETRDADFAVVTLTGAVAAEALTDLGVPPVLALDDAEAVRLAAEIPDHDIIGRLARLD